MSAGPTRDMLASYYKIDPVTGEAYKLPPHEAHARLIEHERNQRGFDCGQCGGQCDTCKRAEREHERNLRAYRIGYLIRWPLVFITLIILIWALLT